MLIECFVDGASRGQGQKKIGDAACSVVICKNKKVIAQYTRGLGKRTNNEAEYEAVIHALLMCVMADLIDPIIYSDSAVVVNQINGKWECNNTTLIPLYLSAISIKETYNFRLIQVSRDWVGVADTEANGFLDILAEKDPSIKSKAKKIRN